MSNASLEGIRVVELARVLAGPWAGQILADLGADVVKVENPKGGDDTRHWGPPFLTGADGENLGAAYFHSTNRGKRSVTADLRDPEDQEFVRQLVAQADILIENFKTGGLEKYGLDYESACAINPKLVYCSITGFGHSGPYASHAGYDFIIQGMSGFMSITGEPDGQPMKAGVAIADIVTGLYAVSAIQAALIHAMRTGKGQHIDMALLDSQAAILSNQNMNFLATGQSPTRLGNFHPNISPYEVVPTSDGYLILAIGNDGQFQRLCKILGADDIAADPRFATNRDRVANRSHLRERLCGATQKFERSSLLDQCKDNAVPAGPINSIGEMFDDPQIKARNMRVELDDGRGTKIPGVASPIKMSETPPGNARPSPRLGEHNDEVRAELRKLEGR
ncbi:CaiB/BaiF CoA transferase family protein [Hoeflea prorocentri]|uniref:CaiB/BaiF CoA-transferase family protein n=1 Tax=Hoeflea prorocentri TaxID=1922333 RepID=A0A9X3ZG64_9HYPH|nr:CaiB/BaiF CoA-transferase family protein [Hoeflea prorocentri]MCY6379874.1 CaiB/BaiF CoA-transferase family protein [Hoeflea prorocentri]MDA5397674.1 CaiB/BaiF CoA-transferase family protein [Hoeflea prorocentri]